MSGKYVETGSGPENYFRQQLPVHCAVRDKTETAAENVTVTTDRSPSLKTTKEQTLNDREQKLAQILEALERDNAITHKNKSADTIMDNITSTLTKEENGPELSKKVSDFMSTTSCLLKQQVEFQKVLYFANMSWKYPR